MSGRPGRNERRPGSVLDLIVGDDGRLELHYGRAAAQASGGQIDIIDVLVAGVALEFCAFAGGLYSRAGYRGYVDLGVGTTEIEGAESHRTRMNLSVWLDQSGFENGS